MSFKVTINCPDCGSPIPVESNLLLSLSKFGCPNPQCETSIALSVKDVEAVSKAIGEYEDMQNQATSIAQIQD